MRCPVAKDDTHFAVRSCICARAAEQQRSVDLLRQAVTGLDARLLCLDHVHRPLTYEHAEVHDPWQRTQQSAPSPAQQHTVGSGQTRAHASTVNKMDILDKIV